MHAHADMFMHDYITEPSEKKRNATRRETMIEIFSFQLFFAEMGGKGGGG